MKNNHDDDEDEDYYTYEPVESPIVFISSVAVYMSYIMINIMIVIALWHMYTNNMVDKYTVMILVLTSLLTSLLVLAWHLRPRP